MPKFLRAATTAVLVVAAFTLPVAALAADGDMSVATVLAKAEALKRKGPLALMSKDIGLLKREFAASAKSYRERTAADKAAGRAPQSCPPTKGSMNRNEFLSHLRSYPVERRPNVTIRSAYSDLMKKRYPC